MKIILTGNPNVGKSVVFSYLTGYTAISSNYPGTTVDILGGKTKLAGIDLEVVDVPGVYSLSGESVADRVADEIIKKGDYDLIINVLDANNLERNLFFAFELIEMKRPMIFLVNKCDIAKNRGINIDFKKLEELLGVKVIPIVATAGIGFDLLNNEFKNIVKNINDYIPKISVPDDKLDKWKMIGDVSSKCETIVHKHPTFLEKLEVITTTPVTAVPFAFILIILSFYFIRFIGEGLINYILDPFFNNFYMPIVEKLYSVISPGILRELLFGKSITPLEGFSVLTTGLYVPFVVVLPYIIAFYIVIGILEDIGYLPRLSVILDKFSHRIGLHGYGSIPFILGLGCKVPGIFSLRILETKREKLIAASLMFLSAPCMPQTAMIFAILSKYPVKWTFLFFIFLFSVGVLGAFLFNKIVKGEAQDLFVEIPPYHRPVLKNLLFKLNLRTKNFIKDAVPFVMGGIFFINILDVMNFFDMISKVFAPILNSVFSLPAKISPIIILGFLKKDVSITLLTPFNLGLRETLVSSYFLVTYLPCLASIFVLFKELGKKITVSVIAFNFVFSMFFSWLFSNILLAMGVQ
ncbi:MAG: ferrous iron transporter B [Elusimicrobia bacterium]|nr:ferrous iron transporter B [Elusimicrobiota bacterium]